MKGIVYCVECEDTGGKYIGSTTRKLNERMREHKNDIKKYDKGNKNGKCTVYDIIKNGNYKSYILEEVEYEVVKDLHKKELEYIEKTDCVNIMRPTLSRMEYMIRYRNGEKREELLQKSKDYYEENKEKKLQRQKDYNEENKEKIKEHKSKVIECECGRKYQICSKARHLKTAYHINYI